MSNLFDLILKSGDNNLKSTISAASDPNSLFKDATWDQVGANQELTKFLHSSIDPNGTKYGGDTEALKTDMLNTMTARGSSAIASIWDFGSSLGESIQQKQFRNLQDRLYESAPNRLFSGDAAATGNAVGAALIGGLADAPLLLLTAGAKTALGVGRVAEEAFKATALKKAGEQGLADLGIDGATQALKQEVTSQGWKTAAKGEALDNFVAGGLGDVAQQNANMQRGSQDQFSYLGAAENAVFAAGLGGALGAGAGYVGGRMAANKLAKDVPGAVVDAGKRAEMEAKLAEQNLAPDTPELNPENDLTDYKTALGDATSSVGIFAERVGMGTPSVYTKDQLRALEVVLNEFSTSHNKVETHLAQAKLLREQNDAAPDVNLAKAADAHELAARKYAEFADNLIKIKELGDNQLTGATDDLVSKIVNIAAPYDQRIADTFGIDANKPAAKKGGKKNAKPADAAAATATPTTPATPATAAAAPSTANAATPTATAAVSAAAPTATAALPDGQAPNVATAQPLQATAATKAVATETPPSTYVPTPEEKAAIAAIKDQAAKDGVTPEAKLQTILAGTSDPALQEPAKIAKAAIDRQAQAALAPPAPPATPAPTATAVPTEAAATPSDTVPPVEDTRTDEQIAADTEKLIAQKAELQAKLEAFEKAAVDRAQLSAVQVHEGIVASLNKQVSDIHAVIDGVLKAIEDDLNDAQKTFGAAAKAPDKERKKEIFDLVISQAKADHPELATIFDQVMPKPFSSEKGATAAKVRIKAMADEAMALHYEMQIGSVLPDPTNTTHFEQVLKAMLGDRFSDDIAKIVAHNQKEINASLIERVSAIGIDNLQKDPVLAQAWNHMIKTTNDGRQIAGGKTTVRSDLSEIVNRNMAVVDGAVKAAISGEGAVAIIKKVRKSVSDFMKQIQSSGAYVDQELMDQILEIHALRSMKSEIDGTFKIQNKEAFDKLEAMYQLRVRDRDRLFTRSNQQAKNPFAEGIVETPAMHRLNTGKVDEDGNPIYVDKIVTGRRIDTSMGGVKTVGGPQKAFSDGISNYLGVLWANPRKMFAAARAVRSEIFAGAIKVASWSKASIFVDGVKASSSVKEIKGRLAETVNARAENARASTIYDLVERLRLGDNIALGLAKDTPENVDRAITKERFDSLIKMVGDNSFPVHPSEIDLASMIIDHKEAMDTAHSVARAEMAEGLKDAMLTGEKGHDLIMGIVKRLKSTTEKSQGNLLIAIEKKYPTPSKTRITERAKTTTKTQTVKGDNTPVNVGDVVPITATKTKVVEGGAVGVPETKTTRQRAEEEAAAIAKRKGKSTTSLLVKEGEPVEPAPTDIGSLVISVGGVNREFDISKHFVMDADGMIKLFGEKIGTWIPAPGLDSKVLVSIGQSIEDEGVSTFASIIKRKAFRKEFDGIFQANKDKMPSSASGVEPGALIPAEMSKSTQVDEAITSLKINGAITDTDMNTKLSDILTPAEGRLLALKSVRADGTEGVEIIGAKQMGLTLGEFLALFKGNPLVKEKTLIGTALPNKKAREFEQRGTPRPASATATIKNVVKNADNAVIVATAQQRPVSYAQASKVKLPDGDTLASLMDSFEMGVQALSFNKIGTIQELNSVIETLTKQAETINALAPHGIKRTNASRRMSFHWLEEHMARFSDEERRSALDFLRRVDPAANTFPFVFSSDQNYSSFGTGSNRGESKITIYGGEKKPNDVVDETHETGHFSFRSIPKHIAVIHETGHWAFTNMLSPNERIEFIKTLAKYYDADGKFDINAVLRSVNAARAIEDMTKVDLADLRTNTNELFAWQFTSYAMQTTVGKAGRAAEQTLWQKIAKVLRGLLSTFLDLPVEPALVPLFERILPSKLSDTKYNYSAPIGKDGKIINVADIPDSLTRSAVGSDIALMETIDKQRGALAHHIFTAGGVDGGYRGELEKATKYFFGLLYGKEKGKKTPYAVQQVRDALLIKVQKATGVYKWVRDPATNRIVKGPNGEGLVKSVPRLGVIDASDLFQRHELGRLMSTIVDTMGESPMSDKLAFEAATDAEEVSVIMKSNSVGDHGDANAYYLEALQFKFKELTKGLEMSKISANEASKYSDALAQSDAYARKEAANFLKDAYKVDIEDSLLDQSGQSKHLVGDDGHQKALMSLSRKLYDMMGDALDELDGQLAKHGVRVMPSERAVSTDYTPSENDIIEEAKKAVAKQKHPVSPNVVEPETEAGAAAAKAEAEARTDGVSTGMPVGAPDLLKTLVSRMTHRDAHTKSTLDQLTYRLFTTLFGDKAEDLTNADVLRLSGLGKEALNGYSPRSMANTKTEAYNSLRESLRLVSEALVQRKAKDIPEQIKKLLPIISRQLYDQTVKSFAADPPIWVRTDLETTPIDRAVHRSEFAKMISYLYQNGFPDPEWRSVKSALAESQQVNDVLKTISDIFGGLTVVAEDAAGETLSVPIPHVRAMYAATGLYHPIHARASVATRLANLPQTITSKLLNIIRANGKNLADNVFFVDSKTGKLFLTSAAADGANSSAPGIADIDAEIGALIKAGKQEDVTRLMAKRDALIQAAGEPSDGVRAVLFDKKKVFDPFDETNPKVQDVEKAVAAGEKRDAVLKRLGYLAVANGDGTARLLVKNKTDIVDLEDAIAREQGLKRNENAKNVPLTGELVLHMALDAPAPELVAVEQRAIQAGAPSLMAKLFANIIAGKKSDTGLSEAEYPKVRAFHMLQLQSNPNRIFDMGGKWLANLMTPKEGTGFNDAFAVRLSADLQPIVNSLDQLDGVKNWLHKVGKEIYRNLDLRGHTMPQSDSETNIVLAMRTNNDSKLTIEEIKVKESVVQLFRKLLIMQRDAGVPVADLTNASNRNYLPQRFNISWIEANREEAIRLLGEWFRKDRKGYPTAANAMDDARRVIHEALYRKELDGMLEGSTTVYGKAFGDKLYQRKLRIDSKDWEPLAPLFDNNLRSLISSYSEAAHKRVEWSKRFGIRGHAVNTYIDIGKRGDIAVIEALMGRAQGMKYMIADNMPDDLGLPPAGPMAVMDNLFVPLTKDRREAMEIAGSLGETLMKDKDDHTRAILVDDLMKIYAKNGGSGIEHFRLRAEAIVNALADFGTDGNTTATHELDFMLKAVGGLEGRPAHTITSNRSAQKFAQGAKLFASTTLLSAATIASFGDTAMPLLRSGSIGSMLKGITKSVKLAMNDPIMAQSMARIGVLGESMLRESMGDMNGGTMARLSSAFFQANMLTPWTNAMRQYSALVGFESIKANQAIAQREMFNNNVDSLAYRRSVRYLRQLGLAELINAEPLDTMAAAVGHEGDFTPSQMKIAEAIHKFSDESIFQPNKSDVPLWAQDPIASVLWQFKSYPMMAGRLVSRLFKEAGAFENGSVIGKLKGQDVGKYAGDPAGLMYLLTIGAALGYGSAYAKDVIKGNNQEGESWRTAKDYRLSKIGQDLGFKDFSISSDGADNVLGGYATGLLTLGALGFVGDLMFQSAQSLDNGSYGRERIMSQIAGPTMGLFSDTLQIAEGAFAAAKGDESNAKARNATRKVLARIPFAGSMKPEIEATVNAVAGDSQTAPTDPNPIWQRW